MYEPAPSKAYETLDLLVVAIKKEVGYVGRRWNPSYICSKIRALKHAVYQIIPSQGTIKTIQRLLEVILRSTFDF